METHGVATNGFQRNMPVMKSRQIKTLDQEHAKSKTDIDLTRQECIPNGDLFEDPDFPPLDSSIYFSCRPNYQFEWLRPHDIAGRFGLNPELYNPGNRFSLVQGILGDYWLLQAATCLVDNPELMRHVIPGNQSFSEPWYSGMFRFHFWRYGKWQEIVVDDRLPTVRGEMVFIHSGEPNEFWGALLEKAYAKLHGSYESLKSGFLSNALHGLTGGLVESYHLQDHTVPPHTNLVNALFKAMERHTILLAHLKGVEGRPGTILQNGLMARRVYRITDIREIKLVSDDGEVPITLARLANPSGEKIIWRGSWGERSSEWKSIPSHDRIAMGLVCRDDAEFWMDFQDCLRIFDSVELCHQLPDIVPLASPPRVWRGLQFHGRWMKGVNAGGRPVCIETHHLNPQYHLRLTKRDEDNTSRCTCLVELTQKDRRIHKLRGRVNVDIGFVIYACSPDYTVPLPRQYFNYHTFHDRCDFFANGEQITKRFLLEIGDYIIIPSTYIAHTEVDFMLRVLMEEDNTTELAEEWSESSLTPIPTSELNAKDRENVLNTYLDVADEDMEIDVFELREILHRNFELDEHPMNLSVQACKALVALVDTESRGRLGYHEYLYIWNTLCVWKKSFKKYEKETSGAMYAYDLKTTLSSLGYRLVNDVVRQLVLRYADEDLLIPFSGFVECTCKVTANMNVFKEGEENDKITLTLEQWLKTAMST